jgi:hypothetical protein
MWKLYIKNKRFYCNFDKFNISRDLFESDKNITNINELNDITKYIKSIIFVYKQLKNQTQKN